MSSFGSKKPTKEISVIGKLIVGGTGACSAVSLCHPIDVMKIRLQLQGEGAKGVQGGLVRTTINVIKNEGLVALTKGLSAAITRQFVYSSIRFGTYPILKNLLVKEGEYLPLHFKIIASCLSGTIGSFFGSPNDLILVRMQGGNRHGYRNVFDGLYKTAKSDGVFGLWRGCTPTVVRGAFVTMGQIASYDQLKQIMLKTRWFEDNLTTHFVASGFAGIIAAFITNPIDVVKTRIMSMRPDSSGILPYKGVRDTFSKILRNEGPKAFYKGFIPAASRQIPSTILTFIFYEKYFNLYCWLFSKGD